MNELHTSLLYNILNPVRSLTSRVELSSLRRFSSEFADLHGDIHRFDAAREVHQRLSEYLGNRKTMGEEALVDIPEEEKEGEQLIKMEEDIIIEDDVPPMEVPRNQEEEVLRPKEVLPKLASLDIVAWAYLKEEIVNTPESAEVKYMRENFPNLIKFVENIDNFLKHLESGS